MARTLALIFAAGAAAGGAVMVQAGPVDAATFQVANWLVGAFDNHAQAAADREQGAPYAHEEALMFVRPLQDPVVFLDGLYLYVEDRLAREEKPYRQRIYRLRKSGNRVRLEVFRIDARLLGPLSSEPQMLTSLAPGDLTREEGCDILLAEQQGAYVGSTSGRACRSTSKGTAYTTSTLRVTRDMLVTLDRGYDEKGVQTFGPPDGRGYEFRRVAP